MAKRNGTTKTVSITARPSPASSAATPDSVEQKVVVLAEQLGRILGTVQTKAEGWFDRENLNHQIAGIRDGAADLLEHLAVGADGKSAKSKLATRVSKAVRSKGRSGGFVDAPGKKHRKPVPNQPAPSRSASRAATMKAVNQTKNRPQRRG